MNTLIKILLVVIAVVVVFIAWPDGKKVEVTNSPTPTPVVTPDEERTGK